MFSTLPWYGKAACLFAFFGALALWGAAVSGFYAGLSVEWANFIGGGSIGLAAGFLLGARYGDR